MTPSSHSGSACIIATCANSKCSRKYDDDWPLPVHVVSSGEGTCYYEPDNPADALCPDCGSEAAWISY